ncbi:MAG: Rieske 2Fe-2S domain-containing protein [Acidimicrobiales bacterium]|nr:Rieske 2Fe-2S domain-containing protein [Acidimicrobiales bacterium]
MNGPGGGSGETVSLGDLRDLLDGQMRCFEDLGENGVLVCRVAGRLHAVDDNCSHADSPLSEGRLRGHTLTCALHGAQFDVRDGSHAGPPAWEGLACYRIEETDGGVVVHLGSTRRDDDAQEGFEPVFRMR